MTDSKETASLFASIAFATRLQERKGFTVVVHKPDTSQKRNKKNGHFPPPESKKPKERKRTVKDQYVINCEHHRVLHTIHIILCHSRRVSLNWGVQAIERSRLVYRKKRNKKK